jgi:hypothetical protein
MKSNLSNVETIMEQPKLVFKCSRLSVALILFTVFLAGCGSPCRRYALYTDLGDSKVTAVLEHRFDRPMPGDEQAAAMWSLITQNESVAEVWQNESGTRLLVTPSSDACGTIPSNMPLVATGFLLSFDENGNLAEWERLDQETPTSVLAHYGNAGQEGNRVWTRGEALFHKTNRPSIVISSWSYDHAK